MHVSRSLCRTWKLAALVGVSLVAPLHAAPPGTGAADRAWQTILEQASGPGTQPRDRDAALAAARAHLDKQEKALRDFARSYPDDPHRYSARIRLAAVLASKGRLLNLPALNAEAGKLVSDLETDPATPALVRADAGFARVSQEMEQMTNHSDDGERESLLKEVRRFDAAYPGDRRTAGLLAELSTQYDEQPAQKKALLEEAATRTADPALSQRIADDLRRVGMLNHPLTFRFQPEDGGPPVEVGARHGRVVVILFWASWSLPSLHEMVRLQRAATEFARQPVDFLTISLDEDRKALASTVAAAGLRWPVQCDERGWKGDLVRSLGINALPTVWVLDRRGNLVALNSHGDQTAGLIRKALAP